MIKPFSRQLPATALLHARGETQSRAVVHRGAAGLPEGQNGETLEGQEGMGTPRSPLLGESPAAFQPLGFCVGLRECTEVSPSSPGEPGRKGTQREVLPTGTPVPMVTKCWPVVLSYINLSLEHETTGKHTFIWSLGMSSAFVFSTDRRMHVC